MLYGLAKIIGTKRPGNEGCLLPLSRMPTGLLEHCINLFVSYKFEQVPSTHHCIIMCMCHQQVHCPHDYREWLLSMFSLFGTKFLKLFCGPMWRVESLEQEYTIVRDPLIVC